MRSKAFALILSLFFCGFTHVSSTIAAESIVWTGINDGSFTILNDGLASGYSIEMYSTANPNNVLVLYGDGGNEKTSSWVFDIEENTAYGTYKITRKENGEGELDLGTSLKFGFNIYDASDNLIAYSYDFSERTWTVTYGSNSPVISVVNDISTPGIASVSAVPIPGSALLLGSSILGLVGISTRRKKA